MALLLGQQLPAEHARIVAVIYAKILCNFSSSAMGEQYLQRRFQPLALRALLRIGQYFYLLAILQLGLNRHKHAVNQTTNTVLTEIGMNSVGKVQHGSTASQIQNMTFRSCDEHTLLRCLLIQQRA